MEKQFVSFRIGDIKYCIDIMDVQEVYREDKITHMPDVPTFVEGIINLRGIVIPIISIRKKLNLDSDLNNVNPERDPRNLDGLVLNEGGNQVNKIQKKSMKLIIVNIESVWVGFLVDALDRVFSIDNTMIQPAEGVASSVDSTMVEGMVRLGEDVFIILNAKKLLDGEEKKFIKDEIIE